MMSKRRADVELLHMQRVVFETETSRWLVRTSTSATDWRHVDVVAHAVWWIRLTDRNTRISLRLTKVARYILLRDQPPTSRSVMAL